MPSCVSGVEPLRSRPINARVFVPVRSRPTFRSRQYPGTLKSEWIHHHLYRTRDEARPDLFFYIGAFYNRRRRHSSLDYLSPEAYEQLYHQRQSVA